MAWSDTAHFLAAFLRNPAKVGAIAPSSPALARAMLHGIRLEPDEAILEFGPGTGPFTEEIRRVIAHPGAYLGIERDQAFVTLLEKRFPDFKFICGSAQDAHQAHRDAGLGRVRAIISGLPFASLPPTVQDGIIDCIDRLLPATSLTPAAGLPGAEVPGAEIAGTKLPGAKLPGAELPGGVEFRTFQYVHAYMLPSAVRFRRRMDRLIGPHTRSRAVWRNLPPSFVLTWRR